MSYHIQRAAGVIMLAVASGLGVDLIVTNSIACHWFIDIAIVVVLILFGSWLVVVKKEDDK